ncbi:MAG: hypothetical protein ACN0LA_14675 [Candidatus Longimicrobiales bacterium M2_2A_002]
MRYVKGSLFIALVLFGLGACASSRSMEEGASGSEVGVMVENNAVPPAALTIWMVKDNGMRQRLGTVRPNGTERYRYNVPGIGEYRLVGTARIGQDVSSQYFTLSDNSQSVTWDIAANSVVVR